MIEPSIDDQIILYANFGPSRGHRSHSQNISESILKHKIPGFDWAFIESIAIPDELTTFNSKSPIETVMEWVTNCGHPSLYDANKTIQTYDSLLLCRPSMEKHSVVLPEDNLEPHLLRQALILSRIVKATFDPLKPPIMTAKRLRQKWDLYTIGGFYAS